MIQRTVVLSFLFDGLFMDVAVLESTAKDLIKKHRAGELKGWICDSNHMWSIEGEKITALHIKGVVQQQGTMPYTGSQGGASGI